MSVAYLETKLAAAPIGFAVFEGPSMVLRSANPRYLEMVSRTTDALGLPWVDIFPELVDGPTHAAVLRALGGESVSVQEFPISLLRDGALQESFYSFDLDPTRGADGAIDGFTVISLEVTELVVRRREAEILAAKLHASEARYRQIFEAMDDGYCLIEVLFDAQGTPFDYRFLEANAAFEQHTGLVGVVGKTCKEVVPDQDESWFRLYGDIALTGEPARFENNAPALSRWFDVFASRVGEASQRRVGVIFKDVSARRRAEHDKEQLLLAEQASRRDAEAANRLKDEFLATVSHELRTPLNAMIGWLTLLRSGRLPAPKQPHALDTIERNARSQAQLIEDLLDVSRILEGKIRLDVAPLDLRKLLEAAIDAGRPAADAKSIAVHADLAVNDLVVGDAQRLQQIASNLLSNAVKFTPKGGQIHVTLQREDDAVALVVTDTGMGIAPEFLDHVFERFRQADGGTSRSHGGLGLGLSIVRHLTELHGGSVSVASAGAGRGASFTVRLPAATARRSHPPPAASSPSLPSSGDERRPELIGLDVVIVDDDEDSREMLRSLLESYGAHVRVAGSAADALALLEALPPRVLLSDIGMPGEDGYTLIGKVRKSAGPARDVPAAALTAYARAEDRTRCLRAGFDAHVPKPLDPDALLEVVTSLATRGRLSA